MRFTAIPQLEAPLSAHTAHAEHPHLWSTFGAEFSVGIVSNPKPKSDPAIALDIVLCDDAVTSATVLQLEPDQVLFALARALARQAAREDDASDHGHGRERGSREKPPMTPD